jgi:hypothetical protein
MAGTTLGGAGGTSGGFMVLKLEEMEMEIACGFEKATGRSNFLLSRDFTRDKRKEWSLSFVFSNYLNA